MKKNTSNKLKISNLYNVIAMCYGLSPKPLHFFLNIKIFVMNEILKLYSTCKTGS